MEIKCCPKCFLPSHDVNRGHITVAVPESCRDVDCPCHAPKQPPAPEKKWEELLLKAHVYDEFRYYDAEGEPTRWKVDYEKLKALIASLLEEKAVEMIERKGAGGLRLNTFKEGYKDGYNDGMDTAAAILLR